MPHLGNGSANIRVNQGASENWRAIWVDGGVGNFGIGVSSAGRSVFGRASMSMHMGASESFRVHSDGWDTVFEVTGSAGNGWFKGDARAPIFYDSNNTGFYFDGASGTNLNYLNVNGAWGTSPFGNGTAQLNINGTYPSITQRQTDLAQGYWLHHVDSSGQYLLYGGRGATNAGDWNWAFRAFTAQDGNRVEFRTDLRAPIFYDLNNTTYYLDPASTSVLSAIDTGQAGTYNQFRTWTNLTGYHGLYSSVHNGAHFYPNPASYGAWKIDGSRNSWGGIEFGYGSAGNTSLMIGSDSNTTGFHNNSYGWQIRWSNGNLFSAINSYGGNESQVLQENKWIGNKYFSNGGEIYGTIFYDANDTGYYINPNSNSNLAALQVQTGVATNSFYATGIVTGKQIGRAHV